MKKTLKIGVVVFLMLVLLVLAFKINTEINYKTKIQKELQNIPSFSFLTLEGEEFSNKNLNKEKSIIFIYYNSGCDFCQHEARSVQKNIELFKNVQLLMISSENKEVIQKFAKKYELDGYENIIFLSDANDDFANRFDVTSIPYFLSYNSDQKLVRKHKGQLSIDSMLKGLK